MGAEDEIAELGEGQENDDEHHKESSQILSAGTQGGGELGHGFVEADILEHLDPSHEDGDGNGGIESLLPVAEEFKIGETVGVLKQGLEFVCHRDRTVDIEGDTDYGDYDHKDVEDVPDCFEVAQFVLLDLDDFFNHVVEYEKHENAFTCHDEVVHNSHIANEFDGTEAGVGNGSTSCRELDSQSMMGKIISRYQFNCIRRYQNNLMVPFK